MRRIIAQSARRDSHGRIARSPEARQEFMTGGGADAPVDRVAEEKAPGFRKQRRIGRLGHADTQEEEQNGCDGRS
jgi:hypothetical protein